MEDDFDKTAVHRSMMLSSRSVDNIDGPASINLLPNGTQLGEFEIVDLIGEGGFGIVYLAYDHSLKRYIALKEYMPSALASRTRTLHVTVKSEHYSNNFAVGLKSFVNEARLLAQFDSPSLVKVYRFWEANGTAYMVMPFYDGITLRQAFKKGKIVPTEEWIKAIFARLLDAVEMMHRAQCFHRDIAPDNILLLEDGSPVLLDFGAARRVIGDLTQCLTVIVKPGFAPIEQYADIPGLKQGAWTDVYALAAVAYYLIAGKPPPAVARIVSDEMVPAREAGKGRYSESFLAGLDRALTVKPEQRIQSIPELRKALGIPDTAKQGASPPIPSAKPEELTFPETQAQAPAADRTLPAGSIDYAAISHSIDWPNPMVSDQRDFESTPNPGKFAVSNKLAVSALGFLLFMATTVAAHWGYMHFRTGKPDQGTVVSAAKESAPSDFSSSTVASSERTDAIVPAVPSASPPASPIIPAKSTAAEAMRPPLAPSTTDMVAVPPSVKTETKIEPRIEPKIESKAEAKTVAKPDREQGDASAAEAKASSALPIPSPENELWSVVAAWDTISGYEAYLKKYPKGRHAAAARLRLYEKPQKVTAVGGKEATADRATAMPAHSSAEDNAGKSMATVDNKAPAAAQAAAPKPAEPESAATSRNALETQGKLASIKPAEPVATPAKTQARETVSGMAHEQSPAGDKKVIKFQDQTMTGDFTSDPETGIVSGKGRIVWANGNQFEGTLVRGVKEGKGQFIWNNGQRYIGEWSKDSPNGKGVLIYANGNRYEGTLKDGMPNGEGTAKFKGGDVYSGSWVQGKLHGHGRYTWASGTYFEGEFKDGSRTANGKLVVVNNGTAVATGGAQQGAGNAGN